MSWFLFYILAMTLPLVHSQTFSPALVPLAVRSPYLNAWLNTSSQNQPDHQTTWPIFWNNNHIDGWAGFIRVDGATFQWLGGSRAEGNATTLKDMVITPTRTIFTMQAGPMLLNVTFLSPIEPDDWVRQSLPFSYVYVEATSTDGQSHSVQFYSDISAEWVSGNTKNEAQWNTTQTADCIYHRAQRTTILPMRETDDIAEDSAVYYVMATTPKTTWQTGGDGDVRGQFARDGKLQNTADSNTRAILDNAPVFGISVDLTNIKSTLSPVVWAIGLVRDPAIQSVDTSGHSQTRSSYFWTRFPTITVSIEDVVSNFPNARQNAIALDERITGDALAISPEYRDLLSLVTRQTMGGAEITVSKQSNGKWDFSDIQMFMKDIGHSAEGRVNPVEVLYASFPMFLYLNPSLGGLLLTPLLQYQNSEPHRNPYAAPDLGLNYPNATGDDVDSHVTGVEHSGSMLIMTLAHARFSGDGSLIRKYYHLLKNWADYLVSNSMTLTDQITSDKLNEQTNLAIKGIIAIQAMSEISRVSGMSADSLYYASQASSYVKQWQRLAFSSDHLLSSFGQPTSWGLIYNLFSDRLLQTNIVDQKIYDSQTKFYNSLAANESTFGLEYDSNAKGEARSDWTVFTASTCTRDAAGNATRDQLLSMVHRRASFNQNAVALGFPTQYDVNTVNSTTTDGASPAQGAMFAILSLNLANQTIIVPPPPKKRQLR